MLQTSITYYHLQTKWLLTATNGNQEQPMVDPFKVLRLSSTHNEYNTSQYAPNIKFPLLHTNNAVPTDNHWYTRAANDELSKSKTVCPPPIMSRTPQSMPQSSISLLLPTMWLLGATIGNQWKQMMHL